MAPVGGAAPSSDAACLSRGRRRLRRWGGQGSSLRTREKSWRDSPDLRMHHAVVATGAAAALADDADSAMMVTRDRRDDDDEDDDEPVMF